MRLIQFIGASGARHVAAREGNADPFRLVKNASSTRDLALGAHRRGIGLAERVTQLGLGDTLDINSVVREGRLLVPLDHPDPAHVCVAITGLTHLGSASSRDAMHAKLQASELSDSMKMFKLGLEGGKPPKGEIGAQPEWAYKGDGGWTVAPGAPLDIPEYAEDAGDEAEVAGLYVIGDAGEVLRVGFALGNEFSDHVMEQRNYLYLAHSKLRQCSYGPELLVGDLPPEVEGTVTIERGDEVVWRTNFLSGEKNMAHSIANLEHHHFKYRALRRPGDVHVYFYGASVLSFADGIKVRAGDQFRVECSHFGLPLVNPLRRAEPEGFVPTQAL